MSHTTDRPALPPNEFRVDQGAIVSLAGLAVHRRRADVTNKFGGRIAAATRREDTANPVVRCMMHQQERIDVRTAI